MRTAREGKWWFKVTQYFSNWILRDGYWDDDGVWVDGEVWRDSIDDAIMGSRKFSVAREGPWWFNVKQYFSNWILDNGYWDDNGVWVDGEVWRDSADDSLMGSRKFNVTREADFNFIVKPSTYWILKTGYWDNDGIWVNHEIWRIP